MRGQTVNLGCQTISAEARSRCIAGRGAARGAERRATHMVTPLLVGGLVFSSLTCTMAAFGCRAAQQCGLACPAPPREETMAQKDLYEVLCRNYEFMLGPIPNRTEF